MTCTFNVIITGGSENEYHWSHDAICDFVKDLISLSIEIDIEVLEDHVYRKYYWSKDEQSVNIFFKNIKRWDVVKRCSYIYLINITNVSTEQGSAVGSYLSFR